MKHKFNIPVKSITAGVYLAPNVYGCSSSILEVTLKGTISYEN